MEKKILPQGLRASFRGAMIALAVALNALCVQMLVETLWRDSFGRALIWWMENLQFSLGASAFIAGCTFLLLQLFGRLCPALLLTNAVFFMGGLAQYALLELRDEPLAFVHLAQIPEAIQVAPGYLSTLQLSQEKQIWLMVFLLAVPLMCLGVRIARRLKLRTLIAYGALFFWGGIALRNGEHLSCHRYAQRLSRPRLCDRLS